jgi:hypothetical protein
VKRLLYCVFLGSGKQPRPGLQGVDGQPVELMARGGLCAATSPFPSAPLVPTLDRVQTYERVVEALFTERTLVPMRFGSILESEAQVARFLRERSPTFKAQLRELAGCVEMGLRIMAPSPAPSRKTRAARRSGSGKAPGRAYLEARARQDRPSSDQGPPADLGRLSDLYRSAFQGLFTRVKVESPVHLRLVVEPGGRLRLDSASGFRDSGRGLAGNTLDRGALSLAFLVPRSKVRAFRRAFSRIGQDRAQSRLSGPWPPYSFVAPGD